MKKFVENIIKCLITIVLSITVVHPVYAMENDPNEVSKPEVQTTSEPLPFHDVGSIDWFYESVRYVYDNELMTGLNETTFGPYENLARAQFAVILHRMNGSPDIEYTNKFPDVADNQWYTDAILWANEAGVVGGYTDTGKFGPGDNINREQMAVMMYRYANYLGYDTSARADISKYTDAGNVNEFAKEAMSWAVGEGIITGKYNETQLDPQGNASRAECATIIMRFMENGGGSGDNPEGIAYHEGVEEIHLYYELDTEKRIIVVYDQEMIKDWKEGEIKVLVNEENNELTHAIKIETITRTSDRATIHYSDPDVNEVVSSVNVNGKEMQNGTITPAEGVEFLNAQSRANIEGSFDAFEEISFKKTIAKGLDLTGSFKIESIDYDLNIKLNWLNTKVNRVYFVVNSKFNAGLHGDVGNIGDKIALAELRIPIAYGAIMIRGTLYAVYNLDGTIDFQWEYTNTTGIDYKKGKLNFVNKNSSGIKEMEMEASLRGGFAIEPGVELFSMDVMTLGAEYGKSFDAKLDVISIDPWEYCLQGDMYSYAKIYGELLPGILDKEFNKELLNKSNAFDLESLHFEETGLVDACTRNFGELVAKIQDAKEPDKKLENIIVELLSNGEIVKKINSEDGEVHITEIPSGKYQLLIIMDGYESLSKNIEIKKQEVLDLGVLMINPIIDEEDNQIILEANQTYIVDIKNEDIKLVSDFHETPLEFEILRYYLSAESQYQIGSYKVLNTELSNTIAYKAPIDGEHEKIELRTHASAACHLIETIRDENGSIIDVKEVPIKDEYISITKVDRPIVQEIEVSNGQAIEFSTVFEMYGPFVQIDSNSGSFEIYYYDDFLEKWEKDLYSNGKVYVDDNEPELVVNVAGTTKMYIPYVFEEYIHYASLDNPFLS